jgi:uncharacterized protein YcgI (DUF1989 family)
MSLPTGLPTIPAEKLLWEETVPGGCHWSWRLPRGTTLRLTAKGEGANLSLVLYNASQKLERYNMPDSLKAQHTAHYTRGHVLMSDMGCAMASITADSLGWHDPLGPAARRRTHAHQIRRARLPAASQRHVPLRPRRSADRDRQVRPDPARSGGAGEFLQQGQRRRGRPLPFPPPPRQAPATTVDLRLDMDVIVAVSSRAASTRPAPDYAPAMVGLTAWRSGPAAAGRFCRSLPPGMRPRPAQHRHAIPGLRRRP